MRIISTDDPGLPCYGERGYALTWTQLRIYLADHPDVRITYARGNERVALRHASDRPELVEPVPEWQEKLLLFRAVDLESPERCVPRSGPHADRSCQGPSVASIGCPTSRWCPTSSPPATSRRPSRR